MNKKYQQALDGIASTCPSGTQHPNDMERIISIFDTLLNAGHPIEDSNYICEYLEGKGWDEEKCGDVQRVYDILETRRQNPQGWSDEFVNKVLSA